MIFFIILLAVVSLYKVRFAGKGFYVEECFSRPVTDSVKGIFIWLVFISHFFGYISYTSLADNLGQRVVGLIGQLMVACFLFYSGYGISEAIKKKKSDYVKTLPKNRILKTLLHFDIAVLIFIIIGLINNKSFSSKQILLSFIGWDAIGNSNWYIFVILVLYILTWISFTVFGKNENLALIINTLLTVGFIVFLYYTRDFYWYNTALCYALGMWVSFYKESFLKTVTKSNLQWFICLLSALAAFFVVSVMPKAGIFSAINILLKAPFFVLVIIVTLTKIKISNKALIFSGQHLFEIFILQRIPMELLHTWGMAKYNIYLYFVLCAVITLIIAVIFRFCMNKLDNLIFKKKASTV